MRPTNARRLGQVSQERRVELCFAYRSNLLPLPAPCLTLLRIFLSGTVGRSFDPSEVLPSVIDSGLLVFRMADKPEIVGVGGKDIEWSSLRVREGSCAGGASCIFNLRPLIAFRFSRLS